MLDEFGRAVKHARSLRGWQLSDVSNRIAEMDRTKPGQKVTAPAITFLSDIEKGKRSISPPTVGKLIHALDLSENWLTRFLADAPDEADEETPKDREAERLIRRAEADPDAPETPEALLILLAEEWSGQRFTDPSLAYNALKAAIRTAAEMRAQGALPSNISAQFQAVMRRVSELNDAGQMDEADAALQDASERHAAEGEALFEALLKQDRLCNRPEAAAKRLIKRLKDSAPAGGLFAAVSRLITETRERGDQQGDPFDLSLALELANANLQRAKGSQLVSASTSLGNCHLALGERRAGGGHLTRARNAYDDAQRMTSRQRDPQTWAIAQDNLGNALLRLGERTADPTLLEKAIAAHRAALSFRTPQTTPMDWATSQNNLGAALQSLGGRTADPALLEQAIAAHRTALTVRTPQSTPMDWATSQHNLAMACLALHAVNQSRDLLDKAEEGFANALTIRTRDHAEYLWADSHGGLGRVALARFRLTGDRSQLDIARTYLAEARRVYALDPDNVMLADFDRYLAEIDAA